MKLTLSSKADQIGDKPTKLLSLRDVLERTAISRSLLYELIKDPNRPFPSPVHIRRRSVWVEGEVEQYIADVIRDERSTQQRRSRFGVAQR